MRIYKTFCTKLVALFACVFCGLEVCLAATTKPNIIVIMADDMGYADAGFTGSQDIKTPNLDEIAASGMVFKQGYVTHPYCGPSRAGLLSGRYQHRFGFETNPAYDPANSVMGIDPDEKLFPERLKEAGYVTGCIGKWHLGAAEEFNPINRGFNYFYGFLGGGHDYFRIDLTKAVKEGYLQGLIRNNQPADFKGYLTTALSGDAAEFVETNKDNPFFLYLAYNAPHAPQQAPDEDVARYAHIPDKKRRIYAAMVDVMDRGIGDVVAALEKHGIRENTLLFFLSDNGGPQSSPGKPTNWNGSSNTPFRGGKGNMYDGGVHVPFILSWPARIARGQTFEAPVHALDIAATAVGVAGADTSAEPIMEGVDLTPYLTGQKKGAPHDALFWRGSDGRFWSVLDSNGTKHVQDKDSSSPQLFHLPNDISEAHDVLVNFPDEARELYKKWSLWNKSNVPCRLLTYTYYHEIRDDFFRDAVPKAAKQSGFPSVTKSIDKK